MKPGIGTKVRLPSGEVAEIFGTSKREGDPVHYGVQDSKGQVFWILEAVVVELMEKKR